MSVSKPAPLVLLVDDFDDTRDLYRDYLEFLGYRVAIAETGEEAIDRTFVLSPDVILMDLSLPGLDGCSAAAHLKDDERSRNIPIVAFTGHVLEASRERARRAGCSAFITKPCEPSTIANTLHDLLGIRTPKTALPEGFLDRWNTERSSPMHASQTSSALCSNRGEVSQLVGIPHDIDRLHHLAFDLESRGLHQSV